MFLKNQSNRSVAVGSEGGFSLIEVAISLMIIALLMIPIIRTYSLYIETKKLAITNGVTSISRAAVLKYFEKYGVYPTPANPSIAQGSANFGVPTTGPWPACSPVSTVVCQTTNTGFGTGIVLIGDVPFAALGIPFKSTVDGYGKKLKYAVTLSQTNPSIPFSDAAGAIEIIGLTGPTTAPVPASIYPNFGTPRSHFAVISLGQNGIGAFTLGGIRPTDCNMTSPVPDESENCNNDGVFRNNLDKMTGPGGGTGKTVIFEGGGTHQFDDYVSTTNTSSYGLWSYIPNTLQDMQARNGGNIKIGKCPSFPCVPTSHVDVEGSVQATTVETSRICGSAESSCTTNLFGYTPRTLGGPWFFSPTMLTGAPPTEPPNVSPTTYSSEGGTTGAGIRCYQGSALKGIRNYDEVCAQSLGSGMTSAARFTTAGTPVSGNCTGTTYATGITINPAGNGYAWICSP